MEATRFEPIRLLGRGGFGEVYLARDRAGGGDVALKVLAADVPVEAMLRFRREAKLLAELAHPAIVPVLDSGHLPEGQAYYAMPYIRGAVTLGDWIVAWYARTARPPPPRIVLELLAPIAAALDHLHSRPVLHRDIKPSNVLVLPDGRPVLIDFGLAGFVHSALTKTGMVVGTMAYMPPEQARTEEVGPPADLYQVGLLLYEIVTGVRACQDLAAYLRGVAQHQRAFPPPSARNPAVGRALEEVVLAATDPDPARRPASGAALVEAVRAVPATDWYAGRDASEVTSSLSVEEVQSAALAAVEVDRSKAVEAPVQLAQTPQPAPPRRTRKTGRSRRTPQPAARASRHLALALSACGVALVMVAAGLIVTTSPRQPELGAPRADVGLASAVVTFTCTPAGRAALEVSTPSGARTLHAAAPAASHRFVVRDLAPGERVRLRPSAEGARGPWTEVVLPPDPVQITSVAFGADALEVNLKALSVVRCALRIPTATGPLSVGGSWEGASHRIEVPLARFPFSARWTAVLTHGDDRIEVPVRLPVSAREAHAAYVVEWMNSKEREVSDRLYRGAEQIEGFRMGEHLASVVPMLPPSWLLDELGGREGVLDDPDLSARVKDRFGRAIGKLEALDALMELCRVPHLYPHEKLYGARMRPARASALTTATVLPIELDGIDRTRPFHVLASHLTDEDVERINGVDRTLRGSTRKLTIRAEGRVSLGALPRGARVELAARLAIPGGRFLCVELNGHEVRLVRPDRAAPLEQVAPYFAAVDPAFLREGPNTVVLTVPPMPPAFESAFGLSDVRVDPPGVAVRIGN